MRIKGKTEKEKGMYDIVIIGAGVSGACIARELSRYQASVCVLEKEDDVCCGTSKANSAIIHGGYDAQPGTLKAKLNVMGNQMMDQLSKELDIPFIRNGALVVCTDKNRLFMLRELMERGEKNGVTGLRLLDREEAFALEPNLAEEVEGALQVPESGIICPFELNLAMAENAHDNGVRFSFCTEVTDIKRKEDGFLLHTSTGDLKARIIINAAGVHADEIHNMVSRGKMNITARKGEYLLLDQSAGKHVKHTIFSLPDENGKGVLVTPTVHGNLLTGPTAQNTECKEETDTTAEGMEKVREKARKSVKNLPFHQVITSFAGLRACGETGDFIIEEVRDCPGFFDCAGIESPGLSSSPAIGVMMADMVSKKLDLKKKEVFCSERKGILKPEKLTTEERNALIKEKPAYGNMICRCEQVSEGEIIEAVTRPLGAVSLAGIKRRTRAGMGRCQSGFCAPRVMEILERERKESVDVVVIGGGPAGMAAAIAAKEETGGSVLILERDEKPGGILNQCIHNGFGLHTFQEELTGPEYAARFMEKVRDLQLDTCLHTMVLSLEEGEKSDGIRYKYITAINREKGIFRIRAKAVILAMGCRERPRGALNIPGSRPAGIYTAGTAQYLVNIEGRMPGKEVVILGSGDIGLIMARRMTLEGAHVQVVAERMPYCGGLKRNVVQCLEDFHIPLKLSHTVVKIQGKERLEAVTLAQVDENNHPIPGTEETYSCDTLLLSCGLIPENELSREAGVTINSVTGGPLVDESLQTSVEGIFACGNVLHVHDLVDDVSREAAKAGVCAARYAAHGKTEEERSDGDAGIVLEAGEGIRYTVPSVIHREHVEQESEIRFRVKDVYQNCSVCVYLDERKILKKKRQILVPGEMESVVLKKEMLEGHTLPGKLRIQVEEEPTWKKEN